MSKELLLNLPFKRHRPQTCASAGPCSYYLSLSVSLPFGFAMPMTIPPPHRPPSTLAVFLVVAFAPIPASFTPIPHLADVQCAASTVSIVCATFPPLGHTCKSHGEREKNNQNKQNRRKIIHSLAIVEDAGIDINGRLYGWDFAVRRQLSYNNSTAYVRLRGRPG